VATIAKEFGTMTNTEKKMTKATAWAIVKEIVENSDHPKSAELVEKIDNELNLLAKKNSAEKKPTAQQVANDGIKTAVLATMANDPNRLFTITELLKAVPNLPEDMSLNRMSALVRQLKDAGKVIRTEDKRKAYFSLAK
jgi:DNA-binding transcriptional regulator GbsR (MarR family)